MMYLSHESPFCVADGAHLLLVLVVLCAGDYVRYRQGSYCTTVVYSSVV
jgi:hypothetical protein